MNVFDNIILIIIYHVLQPSIQAGYINPFMQLYKYILLGL